MGRSRRGGPFQGGILAADQPPPLVAAGDVLALARVTPAGMASELSRTFNRDGSRGRPTWHAARHLRLLSLHLTDVFAGRCDRLIVTMPPRHGKSELVSHYAPAWWLDHRPADRIMLASYEADFAAMWSRKVRDTAEANRPMLRFRVSDKSAAMNRWDTTAGGGMVSAGVGGAFTGRGANLLIIDDPVKNAADADSRVRRNAMWEWYTSTSRTRLEPGGAVVIVMTRWHEDDLVGRLLSGEYSDPGQWRVVHLPAMAEPGDPIGRADGAALWPARYPDDVLARIRDDVGARVWGALYQGHPAPVEGDGLWQRADLAGARALWATVTALAGGEELFVRALADVVVAVDPPGSESTECGIVVAGRERGEPADGRARGGVLDDRSMRGTPEQWGRAVVRAAREWNADRIVAEKNYGGDMVKAVIRQVAKDVPVKLVTATRGKRVRAEPVHVPYEQGRIWHRRQHVDLEQELVTWQADSGVSPNRLDALVWALTDLRLGVSLARIVGRSVWD